MPCLYLANSIYTCWAECRLPEISTCVRHQLDSIYAARFEFARPPLLLDLCYPPWALKQALWSLEHPVVPDLVGAELAHSPIGADLASRVRYLGSWLAIWPLLAAASVRTRTADPPDTAKQEYLVPQMLMTWVRQSLDFDGIRYFSTREPPGIGNYDYAINYAFPVKTSMPSGHCQAMRRLLLCTPPVGFGSVAGADIRKHLSNEDFARAESRFRRYMIVNQNGLQHYYGTTYCDMEYVLDCIPPLSLAPSD